MDGNANMNFKNTYGSEDTTSKCSNDMFTTQQS